MSRQPKLKARGGKAANAPWAEGEDPETTVPNEEVDESGLSSEGILKGCSVFTSFLPTFHNASAETSANTTDRYWRSRHGSNLGLWSNPLSSPLDLLSDEDAEQAKRIHLRVASSAHSSATFCKRYMYIYMQDP